jgi:hypothetical protein
MVTKPDKPSVEEIFISRFLAPALAWASTLVLLLGTHYIPVLS